MEAISSDGLLCARAVERRSRQIPLSGEEFTRLYRNNRPVILENHAVEWFCKEPGKKERLEVIQNLVELDGNVEVLVAKDGKNFLKNRLCLKENTSLRSALSYIFETQRLVSDQMEACRDISCCDGSSADPLEDSCRDTGTVIEHQNEETPRKYLRLYLDSYPTLGEGIDLNDLVGLAYHEQATGDSPNPTFKQKNVGLWFSMAGCTTPLHFDICHGFLAQVVGKKTFLMAPSDDPILRCYWQKDRQNDNGTTSPINLGLWLECDASVRRRFPLLDEVEWFIATLQDGDTLYTPPGWWHHVVSESASVSLLLPFDPISKEIHMLPLNVQMA